MTYQPNYPPPTPPAKSRTGLTIGIIVASVFALCMLGTVIAVATDDSKTPARPIAVAPTVAPETPAADATPTPDETPTATPKPTAAPQSIDDGLYHVGEDIPPGTYRLAEPVTSSDVCYWKKSKDAEGSNIIDNDLAGAGRLQVTLKRGQWFETSRCGTWVRKASAKAAGVKAPRRAAPVKEPEPVHYGSCAAVRAAGAAPIHKGDPGYSRKLDRDGDGTGCER